MSPSPPRATPEVTDEPQPQGPREALIRLVARGTISGPGDHVSAVPGLSFFRRDARTGPGLCAIEPSVILVVQGAKRLLIGDEAFAYGIDHFLVASLDVPASSQVLKASREHPCLGLVVRLDLGVLAELAALPASRLTSARSRPTTAASAVVAGVTPPLLECFKRLVELIDEPDAVAVLGPLIVRELHYRLLASDHTGRLRQLAAVGSHGHVVARAIDELKAHYASPLRVDDLAARVHMSPSSFHHHFRQLTSMSPLQYQKWLRLNEARRLMLADGLDAASAAFKVGYASPSQFSREYARHFGAPPKRDVVQTRQRATSAGA